MSVEQAALAHRRPRRRAEVRQLAQALGALPARRRPGERDVIAGTRRASRLARPPRRRRLPRARARPGSASGAVPSIAFWSEWQTPEAFSRTSTSPGPGGARSSSCSSKRAARLLEHGGADLHAVTLRRGSPAGAQLLDRDVAAHQVARLGLDQRRLLRLADRAELPGAARVEDAAARRRCGARDLALQLDALAAVAVDRRHGRQQRLGVRDGAARRRRPRPGRAPSAARGRARRSGRRGSGRRRGRAR